MHLAPGAASLVLFEPIWGSASTTFANRREEEFSREAVEIVQRIGFEGVRPEKVIWSFSTSTLNYSLIEFPGKVSKNEILQSVTSIPITFQMVVRVDRDQKCRLYCIVRTCCDDLLAQLFEKIVNFSAKMKIAVCVYVYRHPWCYCILEMALNCQTVIRNYAQ